MMDRDTFRLAKAITKRQRIANQLEALDRELNSQLRVWSDSRPNAVGGGTATLAGATFLLRQMGALD